METKSVKVTMPMLPGCEGRRTAIYYGLAAQSQVRLKDLARLIGVGIPKYKDELVARLAKEMDLMGGEMKLEVVVKRKNC